MHLLIPPYKHQAGKAAAEAIAAAAAAVAAANAEPLAVHALAQAVAADPATAKALATASEHEGGTSAAGAATGRRCTTESAPSTISMEELAVQLAKARADLEALRANTDKPKTKLSFQTEYPKFNSTGPDSSDNAVRHLVDRFETAMNLNGFDKSVPGAVAERMYMCCMDYVSRDYMGSFKRDHPNSTADEAVAAFRQRFNMEVRSLADKAIDNLFGGKIRMTSSMTVAAYLGAFRDAA